MKRISFLIILTVLIISCGRRNEAETRIISVSIAPFKYFVDGISGGNFKVNIMVPSGANPHIYEPFPDQVNKLRQSVAYISNGYLGFEMTWLDRFYEMNGGMKRLSLGDNIETIKSAHHHDDEQHESADPHYWVSPLCALKMAASVREFLTELDPQNRKLYEENFKSLTEKIMEVDSMAKELSSSGERRSFMIYHPNLGYLARDYGLEEISVEYEGKEPSPSRLKELIDRAKHDKLKVILIQREYDTKNARVIADETGARVVVIDPLSEDWPAATTSMIRILKDSFEGNIN
jgi:zinc transport system substrate-binding protein